MDDQGTVFMLFGLICVVLGGVFAVRKDLAEKYMRHSRKAFIWRKMLGEERAVVAMQKVFAPFTILIGAVMGVIGYWMRGT